MRTLSNIKQGPQHRVQYYQCSRGIVWGVGHWHYTTAGPPPDGTASTRVTMQMLLLCKWPGCGIMYSVQCSSFCGGSPSVPQFEELNLLPGSCFALLLQRSSEQLLGTSKWSKICLLGTPKLGKLWIFGTPKWSEIWFSSTPKWSTNWLSRTPKQSKV